MYEYDIVVSASGNPAKIRGLMNQYGAKGWEFFNVSVMHGKAFLFCRKEIIVNKNPKKSKSDAFDISSVTVTDEE